MTIKNIEEVCEICDRDGCLRFRLFPWATPHDVLSEIPGVSSIRDAVDRCESSRVDWRSRAKYAEKALAFNQDFYRRRIERLDRLVREEASEPFISRYFNIIANGKADVNTSDFGSTLEALLARHEAEIARLREMLASHD